jgi:hypothetical protein
MGTSAAAQPMPAFAPRCIKPHAHSVNGAA